GLQDSRGGSLRRNRTSPRMKAPQGGSGATSVSGGLRLRCRWRWHFPAEQMALEEVRLVGHRTLERFAHVDVEMTDRIALDLGASDHVWRAAAERGDLVAQSLAREPQRVADAQ